MAVEVMTQQRQRHHQRDHAAAVLGDQVLQFGALGTAQVLFQIAAQVLQHIAVGATGGRAAQGAHQLTEIAGGQLVQVLLAEVAQQAAEGLLLLRVGGHQQVFVAGVEVDQALTADAIGQQALPAGVDEHAVEEVLAQHRVVQAAFLFQRQLRVAGMQGGGEDAAAAFFGQMTVISVQFYPVQAAGRRLLHQHEAAETGRYAIDLGTQRLADVAILLLGHQCARCLRLADQADGRARRAKAHAHLRAERNQLEMFGEHLGAQSRALVSAVVAHRRSEQAGADADSDFGFVHGKLYKWWLMYNLS